MKKENRKTMKNRNSEKGAALVMALLVSSLLLVASIGLLMETTTNALNVTDATSEQQAFNAAESGIQAAVYVLRDNVRLPAGRLINPAENADHRSNRIDYIKALDPADSNLTTTGLDAIPRLSRWMTYDGTATDRVKMGEGAYAEQSGYAYKLEIVDPDNTGSLITYSTTGRLFDFDGAGTPQTTDDIRDQRTYGNAVNGIVIKYSRRTTTQINALTGAASADFGKFTVTVKGTGAAIPLSNRFEIVTTMTQPYRAVMVIRGYIETNTCAVCSLTTAPKIIFDSKTFTLQGSVITLVSAGGALAASSVAGPPPGFRAQLTNGSVNVPTDSIVAGTMTSPEPIRLLIRSTGYGPRGSTKQLEAIIQKNFFNGIGAPATLTLIGPASTTSPATTFTFNPGSSTNTEYSGADVNSTDIIPPIGTSNPENLEVVSDSVDGLPPHPFNGDVVGTPTDVSVETPEWLQSPLQLDATIQSMYAVALASGRYFPSGVNPTSFGDLSTAQGITFCDGNCEYSGDGGGIFVVTGTLTLRGNFNFKGLIIVTGQGGIQRSGGGNGVLQGNVVVAPYQYSQIVGGLSPTATSTFLAPQYSLSGGGNSTVVYNSRSLGDGLLAVDNFVLGVVEK